MDEIIMKIKILTSHVLSRIEEVGAAMAIGMLLVACNGGAGGAAPSSPNSLGTYVSQLAQSPSAPSVNTNKKNSQFTFMATKPIT